MKNSFRHFRNALKKIQRGDLVVQGQHHKSQVGSDWGVGVVLGFDAIYTRVFWPIFDLTFSHRRAELQVIDA